MFGRNRNRSPDECLTKAQILEVLEGVLEAGGREERRFQAHLEGCRTCREFLDEIRREVETEHLSISMTWQQSRISCPHRDLLEACFHGSLGAEEAAYVRFHVERIGCAYCAANLDDIASVEATETPKRVRDLKDEVLRSTRSFLRDTPRG